MSTRYANYWRDFPKRLVEGLASRWRCRWCGKRLPGKRSTFCDAACRKEVYIRCGFGVREQVFDRDGGVCDRCGLDTHALEDRLRQALRKHKRRAGIRTSSGRYSLFMMARQHPRRLKRLHRFWARLGLTPHDAQKSLWEAHHKTPVAEQDKPCGLGGYVTLCIWCHRRATAAGRKKS